jgi:hypothetical protein
MKQLLLLSALSIIVFSCKKENMGDCFKGTGLVKKETRILGDFDSIYVDRRLNIVLVQDSVNFAVVEAGEHLLEMIDTEIKDGKLTLRNNNKCNWVRSYKIPVNIEVHTNNLQHIVMWGASNITNKDTLRFPKLVVEYRDASGNLDLMVDNQLTNIIQHTGAGDAVIHGKTEQLTVYMSSLAFGDYTDLQAQNVYVESRSSADCRVFGNQTFTFRLRGDGNIYYKGQGEIISEEKTGNGVIKRIL